MCSQTGQQMIQEKIHEYGLTGVVICSCSPRMHEQTFRKTCEKAGLNPYMVEIANIREQCSWIHKDMEEATKKAVILARAAIAKVNLNTPLQPGESRVTKRALIIGGGIAGCACAYRLARCRVRVVLLEKENDICMGATRANSAIMHAGYDPHPGTLMAKLNVKGNAMSREICKKLHVSWKDTGSLVVALNDEDMDTLQDLLERGRENGVPGLELWDAAQVRAKEPNVTETAKGALWAPTAAIVNPWEFGLAMAEVAVQNGCELRRRFPVKKIEKTAEGYALSDGKDTVEARYVINAAGVYADRVNNLVAAPSFTVEPTVGEYYLLDKCEGNRVSTVIFQCPGKEGKGVLVAGGAILAIQPILLPVLTVVFLLCLVPTGMVSLGSIAMAASYPVLTLIYGLLKGFAADDLIVCVVGAAIMGGMVIWMHRANIQRIREGKEYRFGSKHKQ